MEQNYLGITPGVRAYVDKKIDEIEISGGDQGPPGPAGPKGDDGKSAYEVYCETTEDPLSKEEWLASLKGEKGDKGDDATVDTSQFATKDDLKPITDSITNDGYTLYLYHSNQIMLETEGDISLNASNRIYMPSAYIEIDSPKVDVGGDLTVYGTLKDSSDQQYALKSDIPTIDTSKFALKSDLPDKNLISSSYQPTSSEAFVDLGYKDSDTWISQVHVHGNMHVHGTLTNSDEKEYALKDELKEIRTIESPFFALPNAKIYLWDDKCTFDFNNSDNKAYLTFNVPLQIDSKNIEALGNVKINGTLTNSYDKEYALKDDLNQYIKKSDLETAMVEIFNKSSSSNPIVIPYLNSTVIKATMVDADSVYGDTEIVCKEVRGTAVTGTMNLTTNPDGFLTVYNGTVFQDLLIKGDLTVNGTINQNKSVKSINENDYDALLKRVEALETTIHGLKQAFSDNNLP